MRFALHALCALTLVSGCGSQVVAVAAPEVATDASLDVLRDGREPADRADDLSDVQRDASQLDVAADSGSDLARDDVDAGDSFDAMDALRDVPSDVWPDQWSTCPGVPRVPVPGTGTVVCPSFRRDAAVCPPGEGCQVETIASSINVCIRGFQPLLWGYACDGAEDCELGMLCCRDAPPLSTYRCQHRSDCVNSFLCHQDADCPCDMPRCCRRDSRYPELLR